MKINVFFNPNGMNEPEGWVELARMPVKDEAEARKIIERLKDENTRFVLDE